MNTKGSGNTQGKGTVFTTKAVEHTGHRHCLHHEGSENTQGKGTACTWWAVEHTGHRQCLSTANALDLAGRSRQTARLSTVRLKNRDGMAAAGPAARNTCQRVCGRRCLLSPLLCQCVRPLLHSFLPSPPPPKRRSLRASTWRDQTTAKTKIVYVDCHILSSTLFRCHTVVKTQSTHHHFLLVPSPPQSVGEGGGTPVALTGPSFPKRASRAAVSFVSSATVAALTSVARKTRGDCGHLMPREPHCTTIRDD